MSEEKVTWITVAKAAAILGLGPAMVRALVKQGRIRKLDDRSPWLVDLASVDEEIARRTPELVRINKE